MTLAIALEAQARREANTKAAAKVAKAAPVKPVFVPTLTLENYAQVVLFEAELKGQMSDGAWENASPSDHWVPWCNATVVVAGEDGVVGRNFFASKTGYAFAKELIDVVGDRMLSYVRVAYAMGTTEHAHDFEYVRDDGTIQPWVLEYVSKYEADPTRYASLKHYVEVVAFLQKQDLAKVAAARKDETLYTEKNLRKDLAAINRAMKLWKS